MHHIDGERIPRADAATVIEALAGGASQLLVAGSVGSGKSTITAEIIDARASAGGQSRPWPWTRGLMPKHRSPSARG
ncbi:hypothetical protein [Actinokineospora enzanensis]|uniref:hypothetical protein n=1 Tax=Actinokineospora enzanensis TaxID=155975 RepID=UPI00037BF08D|nr:hypothetical protein [Actinokineospora enzanensis]